jgi:1-acyl-sn-glycerol-3-phosphate acyltransferase
MWVRFHIIKPIGLLLARKKKYGLKSSGARNAPYRGPFIVIANHQTAVDVFATGLSLRRVLNKSPLKAWAKVEVKHGDEGFLGWLLWRYLGTIQIDREVDGEAPKAIKKSVACLKKGHLVFVHPEGTRFPPGTLGPFKYGVANLARTVPVPILPVASYRREDDNGIQIDIGVPFYMPDLAKGDDDENEENDRRPENLIYRFVDTLKSWSRQLERDKHGMKVFTRMMELVENMLDSFGDTAYERACRLASPEDNEFLRDRVLELLPEGWKKVESKEEAYEVSAGYLAWREAVRVQAPEQASGTAP